MGRHGVRMTAITMRTKNMGAMMDFFDSIFGIDIFGDGDPDIMDDAISSETVKYP